MKKGAATVWLIILNALAFFAGAWAAFGSMVTGQGLGAAIALSIVFLVAFPFPQVFVWRFFRDRYDFSKKKFFLCTLLPPYIITVASGAVLSMLLGLTGLACSFACHAATVCLIIGTVVWVLVGGSCRKRALALILLTVCGTIICSELRGQMYFPFAGLVAIDRSDKMPFVASYIIGIIRAAVIFMIPFGFGVAKLMRIYREEYSLKPQLFMLLAFAPTLLIFGGAAALQYNSFREDQNNFFRRSSFLNSLDILIFTAALAIVSVIINVIAEQIRRRKAIDTP